MAKGLKTIVLFSGGKDSCFALWYALHQGWDVVALLSFHPETSESWMFHYPAVKWGRLQAEAIKLPMIIVETSGEKERELEDLKACLAELKQAFGIDAVVSGAVASEYQKTKIDRVSEETGIRSFAPLWHKNPAELVKEQIELGFDAIITSCTALGFSRNWLGRKLDLESLMELQKLHGKYGIHISGEGGEYETLVLDAPLFKSKIVIMEAHGQWSEEHHSGVFEITAAKLVNKF